MAPAFITAVIPPTMKRRKCQAETTHAPERTYNQKRVHWYTVESNRWTISLVWWKSATLSYIKQGLFPKGKNNPSTLDTVLGFLYFLFFTISNSEKAGRGMVGMTKSLHASQSVSPSTNQLIAMYFNNLCCLIISLQFLFARVWIWTTSIREPLMIKVDTKTEDDLLIENGKNIFVMTFILSSGSSTFYYL